MDPAHFPARQGQGGGWGLLEVIPLCRKHHRMVDDYQEPWRTFAVRLASDYHIRMYLCYVYTDVYLGPAERVEEIACQSLTY